MTYKRPVLLLLGFVMVTEAALPMTDIYNWPGGFQASFTVRAGQRVGGWKAHLTFDTSIQSLQVWKGTVYSMINAGREFVIQNKSSDGLLMPGEDLVVEVQGYVQSKTKSPQGTYYIEGQSDTAPPQTTADPTTKYDYREALRLSILFYDAQRSGKMPLNNPVPWRGDSHLNDGYKGHDLSGGWYDAGDQIKYSLPLAETVTLLEWGFLRFYDGYDSAGQVEAMCDMIKWPLVYMLKTWVPETQTLYVQVGDPKYDHQYWGRPEDSTIPRPVYFVNASCPGSDVAAGMAAAMAAGAIVFNQSCPDTTFSDKLKTAALGLYKFAQTNRGLYSNCLHEHTSYKSSDDRDELAAAAAWLYKLTGEDNLLTDSKSYHLNGIPWALSWDSKTMENDLLLYEITKEIRYKSEVENFVIGWMPGGQVRQTPCGLAWRDSWGSLRYSANTAFLALLAADDGLYPEEFKKWALSQINYMLGDNNYNISYEIGFGEKYPVMYHHRGSSCPNTLPLCDMNHGNANFNLLKGGLVGGPDANDKWEDDRNDYVKNEVGLDYNAGFQGALAGLSYFAKKNELPESPAPLC